MPTRRRYTKKQQAQTVGIATITSIPAAAESTGIPETTIRYWMDKAEFVELRSKTRDQVADEMWAAIQIGVQELVKDLPGEHPLRDKATAVGILYDKHALLTGSATSRTESRDISNSLSDGDLITAVAEANAIAGAGRAKAEDPEPAES